MSNMKLRILQNIYKATCQSRLLYVAEICSTEEGWEETDMIQGSFHKKVLRIPRCATNGVEELEMGTESRRGKILSLVAKYWFRVRQMSKKNSVGVCSKWQTENAQFGRWARKFKDELERTGFGVYMALPVWEK
jgi:hypothetical protein